MQNVNETTQAIYRMLKSLEEMNEYVKDNFTDTMVSSFKTIKDELEDAKEALGTINDNDFFGKLKNKIETTKLSKMFDGLPDMMSNLKEIENIAIFASNAIYGISLTVSIVTTAFEVLKGVVELFFKDYFDSCKEIANGMNEFYAGIEKSGSIFDGFNLKIIETSESISEWKQDLDEVQRKLSELSKKGSQMTEEEKESFQNNYELMKDYYASELLMIEESGNAIHKRAEIAVMTGDLTAEQMQRMVNDAEANKDEMIAKISEQYEEEILLLSQKYMDEDEIITEEGKAKIEELKKERDAQIQLAQDTCGKTIEVLTNGYYEQLYLDRMTAEQKEKMNEDLLALENEYTQELNAIQEDGIISEKELEEKKIKLQEQYQEKEQQIRAKHYEGLSDFSDEELSVLVSMCAMTDTYGGELNSLTSDYVMNLIENWDSLPEETKEVMKDALKPMIEEMENKRTPLFQKAKELGDGILKELKKAFDIHSPSRKTREIFRYLMEGCEMGLADEKSNLLHMTDDISSSVLDQMPSVKDMAGKLHNAVVSSSIHRMQGASVAELNRKATSKSLIQTILNIDGREFAIATSDYIQEELAFKR